MSRFGELEAQWRDQQSGARDHQYDEEEIIGSEEDDLTEMECEAPQTSLADSFHANSPKKTDSEHETGSQGTGEPATKCGPAASSKWTGIPGDESGKKAA